MAENKVKVEVKEMKEVKEEKEPMDLAVDVEKELLSLGYVVTGHSTGPGGESVVLYTKEAYTFDIYEKLLHYLPQAYLLLIRTGDSLSATGRTSLFHYDFKGYYSSRVVRSEEGVINTSHRYTYTFFTNSPWGFSVSVEVTGELDAAMPKGNPVTCEVRPVVYIGPVPAGKGWRKKVGEMALKISSLFSVHSLELPQLFPDSDVYVVLEKTRKGREGVGKSTSTQYLGKAGEVFYTPPPQWPEDEHSVDEDYHPEEDDPGDIDSEEDDFEEEDDE